MARQRNGGLVVRRRLRYIEAVNEKSEVECLEHESVHSLDHLGHSSEVDRQGS
jgi:hypothetical protein